MGKSGKSIGLAIIGCGTIGRIRGMFAKDYPGVEWLGLCDINEELGQRLVEDTGADFFTADYRALLQRPEVNAAIIATDENAHLGPTLCAAEQGHDLFIEKPLATDALESQQVLDAIEAAGVDAVVGYTQRFRRRFLAVKEKLQTGQIGDLTAVVTRAFMNRMVPIATCRRTNDRRHLTPMVVSGTHSLDMSLWLMGARAPLSVYARSSDRTLAEWGTKDATFGVFTTWCWPRITRKAPVTTPMVSSRNSSATSIFSPATLRATSATGSCGGRCGRRPMPGLRACTRG
jgi:predicted dehydrogenase